MVVLMSLNYANVFLPYIQAKPLLCSPNFLLTSMMEMREGQTKIVIYCPKLLGPDRLK